MALTTERTLDRTAEAADETATFGYRQIREFGASVIRILSERVPDCRHLGMTLHGPQYGLDEVEALFSMLTGCMEAVADRPLPSLEQTSVVERDAARVGRLRRALQQASHHSGELLGCDMDRADLNSYGTDTIGAEVRWSAW